MKEVREHKGIHNSCEMQIKPSIQKTVPIYERAKNWRTHVEGDWHKKSGEESLPYTESSYGLLELV